MLHPTRGKILVEVLADSRRTASGLWISEKINEEVPHRGEVISIGIPAIDKRGKIITWGFQEGHIVHFKRVWDQNKVSHYIIKRDQIFAVEHEGKIYGIGEYIIIKKLNDAGGNKIFVPSHFESEVSKQISKGEVVSVGREDKLNVKIGDIIIYHKNEGLSIKMPLQEELWSLKPRAILAKTD